MGVKHSIFFRIGSVQYTTNLYALINEAFQFSSARASRLITQLEATSPHHTTHLHLEHCFHRTCSMLPCKSIQITSNQSIPFYATSYHFIISKLTTFRSFTHILPPHSTLLLLLLGSLHILPPHSSYVTPHQVSYIERRDPNAHELVEQPHFQSADLANFLASGVKKDHNT